MRPSPKKRKPFQHSGSLDRKHVVESALVDPMLLAKTPILCNKYVVEGERIVNQTLDVPKEKQRASSVPRQHLALPIVSSRASSREDLATIPRRKRPSRKCYLMEVVFEKL